MKGLILVTGSEGLVGSRFVEISNRKNFLHLPKEIEFDITNKAEVNALISSYNFSAVVNFAAFTDVGKAEEERGNKDGEAWQVNVEGTRNLVQAVKPHRERIHFIQISTDMVFTGSTWDPGPYKEDHSPETNPEKVTWYGFTKAEAEKVVQEELDGSATILRIIYPVRSEFDRKLDFLRKPLHLYDKGELYPIFMDQHVSISFADEVSQALDKIIINFKKGVFHASSKDTTTPYELISYMLEKTRGVKDVVKQTTLKKFLKDSGSLALRYPQFGGLRVEKTEEQLGIKFSGWKEIIDKLVTQGLGKKTN